MLLALATMPFLFAFAQQDGQKQKEPMCEEVFANIKVFKGVPSSDLIPSMQFMAASLKMECEDCHDPKDYSADNRTKDTARQMILMQRDINAKNFNNRTEVTCMTCHRGAEHPMGVAMPEGLSLRHKRFEGALRPEQYFANHTKAVGEDSKILVRTGTLTAPNDATHKVESKPLEFIQAPGGKFLLSAGDRKIGSDGSTTWYGAMAMFGEPVAVFQRIGRTWRGNDDFAGLSNTAVSGQDTVGKTPVVAVRGQRASTTSTEDLSFDTKTGLLLRATNLKRSTLGTVVSTVDYSNYKGVDGIKVPMKVVVTFADGQQWIMDFKTAKVDAKVSDDVFKKPGN